MNTSKRLLLLFLMTLMLSAGLFAQRADDILSADLPIAYGEASFRTRILDRTGGERSPVGLVLSGGSARAFAHIGVLRYLEEEGIVPDFIISNSMGSIVGLLYSAGLSPDQIYSAVTGVSIQTLFDLGLPLNGGLLDPSRFLSHLASVLGDDLDLSELSIPIIVVAEDLVTKRQVLISEGDFYTVLKASFALPVYFSPVEFRGHLLVDGGITNLVPVNLAFEYADSVIVSTTFYDLDTLDLKNPLTILNVTLDIGKRRTGVEELKANLDEVIWIRNGVEDVSFMEFSRVQYLAEKGYESARSQAERLAALPKCNCWPSLVDRRGDLQVKLEASQNRYELYEHVTMHAPSSLLGPALSSEGKKSLTDDFSLGLGYQYSTGDFTVKTNLGGIFSLSSSDTFSALPVLTAKVDYHLFSHMRTSAYTSLLYDAKSQRPLLSLGAAVEGRLSTLSDQLRLSLSQSVEHLSHFDSASTYQYWGGHTIIATTEAEAVLTLRQEQDWRLGLSTLSLSYQFLSDYQRVRSFLSFRTENEVWYEPMGFYGRVEGWGRFAPDGKGNVPLFSFDGFRTAAATIKAQGHDLSVSTNSANHLVGLNLTVGWRPVSFSPSIGESLIFKNSSVAIYCDLLFGSIPSKANVSLGLELHTDISLLGIRTLPFTIYGGWDQAAAGFVWGLSFTLAL